MTFWGYTVWTVRRAADPNLTPSATLTCDLFFIFGDSPPVARHTFDFLNHLPNAALVLPRSPRDFAYLLQQMERKDSAVFSWHCCLPLDTHTHTHVQKHVDADWANHSIMMQPKKKYSQTTFADIINEWIWAGEHAAGRPVALCSGCLHHMFLMTLVGLSVTHKPNPHVVMAYLTSNPFDLNSLR